MKTSNAWLYLAWKVGKDFNQETETVTIQNVETGSSLAVMMRSGRRWWGSCINL